MRELQKEQKLITSINNKHSREGIVKEATEYYKNLYKEETEGETGIEISYGHIITMRISHQ